MKKKTTKNLLKFTAGLLLVFILHSNLAFSQEKPLQKRSKHFFGLHFDFHANAADSLIGKNLSEAYIDSVLRVLKLDFIQIDCKGHPGYSSYPTKVGNRTNGYVADPLKLYRKVTLKNRVSLYVHYSGLIDKRAIELHPDWASQDADGKPSDILISTYSAYLDSLMIPQLKEISDYGVNGAWIDGECWAVEADYSPKAIADFTAKTGMKNIPRKPGDANYFEWIEFQRNNFKAFIRKYVNAIHLYNPSFEITSNWAYTNLMPDSIDVALDYLSGDLASISTVYDAAFASRFIAGQGLPWDLMSWRFINGFHTSKSIEELKLEASQVISCGGAYQVYNTELRNGSIARWNVPEMKELGNFVRKRQPYCQYSKAIPEVAVLLSNYGFHHEINRVYAAGDESLKETKGITMMLLDARYNVQVVMESMLHGKMNDYKLIVVPGWSYMEESFRKELLAYVSNGGNLLLTGPGPIGLFKNELEITEYKKSTNESVYLKYNNDMALINGSHVVTDAKDNLNSALSCNYVERAPVGSASFNKPCGKGKIGAITIDMGASYQTARIDLTKDFLDAAVRQMVPEKDVEVTCSGKVTVNYEQVNGQKYIHLINMSGEHDNPNVKFFNQIPELYNLKVSVKTEKRPTKVLLQPGNQKLDFKWSANRTIVTVPELKIYSILEIE